MSTSSSALRYSPPVHCSGGELPGSAGGGATAAGSGTAVIMVVSPLRGTVRCTNAWRDSPQWTPPPGPGARAPATVGREPRRALPARPAAGNDHHGGGRPHCQRRARGDECGPRPVQPPPLPPAAHAGRRKRLPSLCPIRAGHDGARSAPTLHASTSHHMIESRRTGRCLVVHPGTASRPYRNNHPAHGSPVDTCSRIGGDLRGGSVTSRRSGFTVIRGPPCFGGGKSGG